MTDRLLRRTALALIAGLFAACTEDVAAPDTGSTTAVPTGTELALTGSWTSKADVPDNPHVDITTAMVPGSNGQSSLYLIGGRSPMGTGVSEVRRYNVATNSWARRADYPIRVYSTNGAGVINGKIYVSGGLTSAKQIRSELYMYDPATNTWTLKQGMPDRTFGGLTGVINNQLYVLTCRDGEDNCYNINQPLNLYRYDPATDQWTSLGPSPNLQNPPKGGTLGGKLYATGRVVSDAVLLVYDPATNTWSHKTPMNHPRYAAAGATLGGKLYIMGGIELDGFTEARTVNVYNPATDSWTRVAPMPTARSAHSAERVLLNGKPRIEVVGGPKPNNLQFTP
jgi:N-acetylneuraminic acid mutarotase